MASRYKKAKKTLDALVRAGHSWSAVFDRVSDGFRLTAEERESLHLEYEAKEARTYSS